MTETVRGAVERRNTDPKPIAVAKSYESEFAEVLPRHIEVQSFLGAAAGALRKNPPLLQAAENAPGMFMNALMDCARLGHSPGSKEYYLTARRSKDHDNKQIIVGIEGYRGVIQRMYRSGGVASVIVREVCQGDRFLFTEGDMAIPVHEIDWFAGIDRTDPQNIIGVYAYAKLTTGAWSRVVVLPKNEIDAAMARSDAGRKGAGPWATDYRAMAWKTAAHRLEPWVPTSAEYRREQLRAAVAADQARDDARTPGNVIDDGVVDAEVVTDEQQQEQQQEGQS
jgi:recombination protein RecT